MSLNARRIARSLLALASLAFASGAIGANAAPDVSHLRLSQPVESTRGPAALSGRTGEYVVTLAAPSLARAYKSAGSMGRSQQQAHLRNLDRDQRKVADRVRQLGGKELARLSKGLNGIVVEIDAGKVRQLEAIEGVLRVRAVNRYELDLSETVPHIGAAAVQAAGNAGAGVRVAVLDSGIDYTHAAMGGPGTSAAYEAAYGTSTVDPRNATADGLFPTAKVVGGYDFVGEAWPTGPLAPDEDPIDFEGHGTHVADIIGGVMTGNVGVAPGTSLYAVKVCSAVSTSCSGVALLQGVEYFLDPNGDGDISDRVDVANLSIGSSYGQDEDYLTAALDAAAEVGVVVVASAGNSADRPYIAGSPSIGRNVISVAQTQVPSAALFLISAGSATVGGSWQLWSTTPALVSGTLQYGDGAGGNLNGCGSFPAGSLAGKVVLVDRGVCAISLKVANGAAGGALSVIVANNASQAPGDLPPDFGYGGGAASVPGYTVTRADGLALKAVLGSIASIDPASAVGLVGHMVASSSRGPTYSRNSIKPDVGAPGASVSAEVGTGTGTTAFGGTSGAAPMVSGAAALLLAARPELTPPEVKALMMNTGDTDIGINPVALPGVLAPVTRIGGGEVRIDAAIASMTAAWDGQDLAGSLSFGYHPVSKRTTLVREVVLRNYDAAPRTYAITPTFRYADDEASGAVAIDTPSSITVPGNASATFNVRLTMEPSALPVWTLDGGARGGDGFRLQGVEFDGYVVVDGGVDNTVHVAWQVLPHRAADVAASPKAIKLASNGTATALLKNASGVLDGDFDVFALTGRSPQIKKPLLPQPGDNFAVIDLKSVGVRHLDVTGLPGGVLQFAVDTYGARAHPAYPAEIDVYVDTNRDGTPDYVVFTAELNFSFAASGQTLVYVQNLATNSAQAYFYLDADLNSGNAILTVPAAALGITGPGTTFDFSVLAFDNYFTGAPTDAIEGMTFTAGTPRYATTDVEGSVPAGGQFPLGIAAVPGGAAASPSQSGLLLMYRDAMGKTRKDAGRYEAQAIEVKP